MFAFLLGVCCMTLNTKVFKSNIKLQALNMDRLEFDQVLIFKIELNLLFNNDELSQT